MKNTKIVSLFTNNFSVDKLGFIRMYLYLVARTLGLLRLIKAGVMRVVT
jgi:hypothetical protein